MLAFNVCASAQSKGACISAPCARESRSSHWRNVTQTLKRCNHTQYREHHRSARSYPCAFLLFPPINLNKHILLSQNKHSDETHLLEAHFLTVAHVQNFVLKMRYPVCRGLEAISSRRRSGSHGKAKEMQGHAFLAALCPDVGWVDRCRLGGCHRWMPRPLQQSQPACVWLRLCNRGNLWDGKS